MVSESKCASFSVCLVCPACSSSSSSSPSPPPPPLPPALLALHHSVGVKERVNNYILLYVAKKSDWPSIHNRHICTSRYDPNVVRVYYNCIHTCGTYSLYDDIRRLGVMWIVDRVFRIMVNGLYDLIHLCFVFSSLVAIACCCLLLCIKYLVVVCMHYMCLVGLVAIVTISLTQSSNRPRWYLQQ